MTYSTLIKVIVVPNSIAGEHKFEIYQDDTDMFYADIYKKNQDGFWVMTKGYYYFKKAKSIGDAVDCCVKNVANVEIDLQTAKH